MRVTTSGGARSRIGGLLVEGSPRRLTLWMTCACWARPQLAASSSQAQTRVFRRLGLVIWEVYRRRVFGRQPQRPFPRGSATPAVLSTAFEAARCGHLPRLALPLAMEDGPRRAAGRGIAEDKVVVGLIRPEHRDFDYFVVGDLPDADGHWLILR